jgi:hypothetical protein
MPPSFYDLSVGRYLQTVGAVAGFLERRRAHWEEAGNYMGRLRIKG